MCRLAAGAAILVALAASAARAQLNNDVVNFQSATWEGIHFYGVNAFTSYVSSAYPLNNQILLPAGSQLGYDLNYGVSASAGWQFRRDTKSASVLYTGSYNRSQNYSSLSSFGHSLRANATWEITPKWSVNVSAAGVYQTLAEYLYQPTSLSVISQVPATASDLAAAMSVGQFSNSQAASMLTGGGLATGQTATTTSQGASGADLLLGVRVLTYSGQASVNYQATSRLSLYLSGVTASGQNRAGGSNLAQQTYFIPRTYGLNAGAAMSYSLTPRTSVGVDVNGARISNQFQGAYTTMVDGSFGRMMGLNWFLRGYGGAAFSTTVQQQSGAPKSRQLIGGGSLGYRLEAQTLVASYNRTSLDTSGLAVGTDSRLTAAWSWRRPGSGWNVFASVGEQRLDSTGFMTLSGWQVTAGWGTRFGPNMTVTTQYVYSNDSGIYLGNVSKITVNSVRLMIGWAPSALMAAQEATASAIRP